MPLRRGAVQDRRRARQCPDLPLPYLPEGNGLAVLRPRAVRPAGGEPAGTGRPLSVVTRARTPVLSTLRHAHRLLARQRDRRRICPRPVRRSGGFHTDRAHLGRFETSMADAGRRSAAARRGTATAPGGNALAAFERTVGSLRLRKCHPSERHVRAPDHRPVRAAAERAIALASIARYFASASTCASSVSITSASEAADRRLVANIQSLLRDYGHAELTTDAAAYRPAQPSGELLGVGPVQFGYRRSLASAVSPQRTEATRLSLSRNCRASFLRCSTRKSTSARVLAGIWARDGT